MWEEGLQEYKPKKNVHKELFDKKGYLNEEDALKWLVKYFETNIGEATKYLLGVDLFPFQELIVKTMLQKDYVLGILSRGIGKCQSPETLVLSGSGFKKLLDLKVGEKVKSLNNFNTVIDKFSNPPERGFVIKTKCGTENKVKNDHRLYVYNKVSENHEFVSASDLNKNIHLIPVPTENEFLEYLKEKTSLTKKEIKREKRAHLRSQKEGFYYDTIEEISSEIFETIGITVENEHNYWGNGIINHNSFQTAIFAGLQALFMPNCKIAILSRSFRQSRMLFQTLEDLSAKPEAGLFSECMLGNPSHANDAWQMKFDNGSSVIALPLGDGCQVLDTKVLTQNGVKTFKDYMPHDLNMSIDHQEFTYPNQKIWSNGEFRGTDQQFYNGIRNIKKITTKKGFCTGATLNHKFKTTDGKKIIWKKTEDYKIGDPILIDKSVRWHNNDTDLTEDECYSFGALIGDGCFKNESGISFATIDNEIIEIIKKSTPFRWTKCSDNVHWYGGGGKKTKNSYLSKFDYTNKDLWETENKKIPSVILKSSKKKMSAFISGLFDTDGSVHEKSSKSGVAVGATFYNTSESLIDDLQYILLHYGIISKKITRNRCHDKRFGKVNWKTSYELHILGENFKIFAEEIGFKLPRKQKILKEKIETKKRWRSLLDNEVCVDRSIILDIGKAKIKKGSRIGDFRGVANMIKRKVITRNELSLFIENYEFTKDPRLEDLKTLCDPNIYFDRIAEIEDSRAPTADLHVPDGHEYCANGFFSHNSKLRGFRFNCIIIDELLLMPEKILNEVIMPFLSTNADSANRVKAMGVYREAIEKGLMTEKDLEEIKKTNPLFRKNKMIGLSSASYQFEYLYTIYKEYIAKIKNGSDDGKELLKDFSNRLEASYAVFQMSYDIAPEGLYDEALIDNQRSQMSAAQFQREFGSQFTDDSSGFFSVAAMERCTAKFGERPCTEIKGDSKSEYILAVDPNASESDDSDLFAMVLFKLNEEGKMTQVHSYGIAGAKYNEHIRYLLYLLNNFNIKFIVMDNAGGVQFLRACQESQIFKDAKVLIDAIEDVDLSKSGEIRKSEIRKFKRQYNEKKGKIVYFQKFSGDWIRESNEDLQFSIDSGIIRWASDLSSIESEFTKAQKQNIGIKNIKFTGDETTDLRGNKIEEDYSNFKKERDMAAKQIDFIEHQGFLIELTKRQIAAIEPKMSESGSTMQFVLPKELKNQKGKNRTRRDLYTAVLMANWGAKAYLEMKDEDENPDSEWEPELF